MVRYLLIASRDTFTARDVDGFLGLAASLAAQGHPVTVFLVQNGVLSARRGSGSELLTRLTRSGVGVMAEKFSLSERGIGSDRLAAGIEVADLGHVVDALADGVRVLWS
jgi:sulfur relay (sulfurtransferase) complex TusBCD TusD component (DsrE family)